MTDFKTKFLKFSNKERQWIEDMALVVESEKTMKVKYEEMERKLQEKEKELEDMISYPIAQSSEHTIVQSMSQVSSMS